jgi:hypothetical protein
LNDKHGEEVLMKRIIAVTLLLSTFVLQSPAQSIDKFYDNAKIRKDLALTDKEVKDLHDVWSTTQQDIQVATADRDLKTAELKRLLVEPKVNMIAVQKTLREAMDIEYKLRLAQVERTVKSREILGEERWARMRTCLRTLRGRVRRNDGADPREDRRFRMAPPRHTTK